MMLLFRCSTGESWHLLMFDAASSSSSSSSYSSSLFAYFYFTLFVFLSMVLFLNLFVAVIMDNFEYLTRDSAILGPQHLDEFVRAWSEEDPHATGKLHYSVVVSMLTKVSRPVFYS